jgi:hypothetical protein
MTAQVAEVLRYQGRDLMLHSEPLDGYLRSLKARPPMPHESTACWRGYVGTWEIRDGHLYLLALESLMDREARRKREGVRGPDPALQGVAAYSVFGHANAGPLIRRIFPDAIGPVLADWYTGPLVCPEGDHVQYFHGGYGGTWERERRLWVEHGRLVHERVRENFKSDISIDDGELKEASQVCVPPSLRLYHQSARYIVFAPDEQTELRAGAHSALVDRLIEAMVPRGRLRRLRASWRKIFSIRPPIRTVFAPTATFISAWNPYGEECCVEENSWLTARLRQELLHIQAPFLPAERRDADGMRVPEKGFLAIGLREREMHGLLKAFGQFSAIFQARDQPARFVLMK